MNDDVLSLTATIVSAHVSRNNVPADQLPTLIKGVHEALSTVSQTVAEPQKAVPAVSAKKSVFPDRLVCLDCGKGFKVLKGHIAKEHGLTPQEYRAKWGLQHDYPMVSADYASRRSQLALASGLGRKAPVEAAPTKKGGRAKKGK
jgi:predicted transcriptional regulator